MKALHSYLCITALLAFSTTGHASSDAINGKALYQERCAACHSVDFNGIGPMHRGVVGRLAAKVKGFSYSKALTASGLVWNESTLDRWLTDPEKLVPGQTMGMSVPEAQARADLIAFLKQQNPIKPANAKE
jgi:cytochrome c